MASASPTTELAVALSLLPALAWGAPALSGAYRAEPLGRVELTTQAERVTGVMAPGNACNFEGRKQVLEGVFEGSVLVGTLTLCQTGEGCAQEQVYPLLAIYNPAEGSLSANLRLKAGCQSPALLPGARLVWMPAGPEKEAPASVESATPSASSVASKREVRLTRETLTLALKEGEGFFRRGDYARAAEQFQGVVDQDPGNAIAHHLLGASLLMREDVSGAIEALKKARRLDGSRPETFYLLACAYGRLGDKRQGLRELRQAKKLGYSVDAALWSRDRDLQKLLESEAELERFLKQGVGPRQAQTRERQSSSDP